MKLERANRQENRRGGMEIDRAQVWDARARELVTRVDAHSDYISGIRSLDGNKVISAGGDGTLSVTDIRKGKRIAQSESSEVRSIFGRCGIVGLIGLAFVLGDTQEDFTSICIACNAKRVLCGSYSGSVYCFDPSVTWVEAVEHLPPLDASVESLSAPSDNTLMAGEMSPHPSLLHSKPVGASHPMVISFPRAWRWYNLRLLAPAEQEPSAPLSLRSTEMMEARVEW